MLLKPQDDKRFNTVLSVSMRAATHRRAGQPATAGVQLRPTDRDGDCPPDGRTEAEEVAKVDRKAHGVFTRPGEAVQVELMEPQLKAPGTMRFETKIR